jgi:hypothetical protein
MTKSKKKETRRKKKKKERNQPNTMHCLVLSLFIYCASVFSTEANNNNNNESNAINVPFNKILNLHKLCFAFGLLIINALRKNIAIKKTILHT